MNKSEHSRETRLIPYPSTLFQKVLNVLCIFVLLFSFLYLIFNWKQVPDRIITHWGFSGQADGWGPKGTLIILPFFSLFVYLSLTLVERFPGVWNTPVQITMKNRRWIYQNLKSMLILLKFLILFQFALLIRSSILQENLSGTSTILFLVLIFGSMVFFIVRSTRKPPEDFGNQKETDGLA